jgi:hypothetical protein
MYKEENQLNKAYQLYSTIQVTLSSVIPGSIQRDLQKKSQGQDSRCENTTYNVRKGK